MLGSIILTFFIIFATHYYYNHIYLTRKKMYRYKRLFEQAGYKVYFDQLKPFASSTREHITKSEVQYGDPFRFRQIELQGYDVCIGYLFNRMQLTLLNPDLIQAFFNNENGNYIKYGPVLEGLIRVLGRSIGLTDGNEWRRKRKIMSNTFHFDFLKALIPSIGKITDDYFEELVTKNPGKKFVVLEGFQDILSTVMVKMFFGADLKGRQINGENVPNFVSNIVADGARSSFDLPTMLFGKKFPTLNLRAKDRDMNRRLKLFREFAMVLVSQKVDELKRTGFKAGDKKNGNLIEELYLANSLSGTGSEDIFDFHELIDEFCGFFFAGTDTTSHLLTAALLYLARNPAAKEKMIKEIDEVIKSEQDYTDDNLKKLTYTIAVTLETHRLFGPGTSILNRISVTNHKLNGIPIEPGIVLTTEFLPNNYNKQIYKNPEEFNPDRWLEQNKNLAHPYQFTPFSSGQRNCIGQHLARLESRLILAKLFKKYDIEVEHPEKIKFARRLLVYPENFYATLVPRKLS